MAEYFPPLPQLVTFLVASFVLAVTPRPGVVYVVTRTLVQGRRSGLALVAGVALGNLGNATGAALGLGALWHVHRPRAAGRGVGIPGPPLSGAALDMAGSMRNHVGMLHSKADEFLARWTELVGAGDVEGVLTLYDDSAVLVPTFSNRVLTTRERIREYFTALGARDRLGITLHEKPRVVTPAGEQMCALGGIYRWQFAVDDELLNFEARFSFFLDFARAAPILHHHSSQIPRSL